MAGPRGLAALRLMTISNIAACMAVVSGGFLVFGDARPALPCQMAEHAAQLWGRPFVDLLGFIEAPKT
jgi:hypothetical protein